MSRIIIDVIIPILNTLSISIPSISSFEGMKQEGERGGIKTNLELEDKDQFQTFSPFLRAVLSPCFEGFDIWFLRLWVNT
jgi:hypothetical protein